MWPDVVVSILSPARPDPRFAEFAGVWACERRRDGFAVSAIAAAGPLVGSARAILLASSDRPGCAPPWKPKPYSSASAARPPAYLCPGTDIAGAGIKRVGPIRLSRLACGCGAVGANMLPRSPDRDGRRGASSDRRSAD